MPTYPPTPYLLSGASAQAVSSLPLDTRGALNYNFLYFKASSVGGPSASSVFVLEGSLDAVDWVVDSTYTATATQTGSAVIVSWYPYIRFRTTTIYSGVSGTGAVWVGYAPLFAGLP